MALIWREPNLLHIASAVLILSNWCFSTTTFAQDEFPLDVKGIWSGLITTQDRDEWAIEDFSCFSGCPPEVYQFLTNLIDDPANDDRPYTALQAQAQQYARDIMAGKLTPEGLERQAELTLATDPVIRCEPFGFFQQVVSALPITISQEQNRIIIDYEVFSVIRTIHMDGRDHPADLSPSAFGHSIGQYEGSTLVVETRGILGSIFSPNIGGGAFTEQAWSIERYSRSEDGVWLQLEFSMNDPVMLIDPWTVTKRWLSTPDEIHIEDSCEDVAGQP